MRTTRLSATALIVILTLWSGPGVADPIDPRPLINLTIQIGRSFIWLGHSIRYTVYGPTRVEARIHALGGETVMVMPLGIQPPGQYTLPFDGTMAGAVVFAGKYELELFFGEEYAAHFWFVCLPIEYDLEAGT